MALIRPSDRRYAIMPFASGPGMHGSELDAAWSDLKDYLPPTLRAEFADQLRVSSTPIAASGAAMVGEQTGKEDALMPTRNLYEIAMLVTGKWGHNALPKISERVMSDRLAPSAAAFQRQTTKGVFDGTEFKPTQYMDFWTRMEMLDARLEAVIETLKKAYAEKAKRPKKEKKPKKSASAAVEEEMDEFDVEDEGTDLPLDVEGEDPANVDADSSEKTPTPWLHACARMQQAVRFVLAQRNLRPEQRSIFGADTLFDRSGKMVGIGKLMPLGMKISVLKADGNSKLPFIAYSELPMSTCPGAGDCGVYSKDASTGAIAGGWCYSFKAWRYPDAFKRQFLNTLANYADREFTILRNNGDDAKDGPNRYWDRINAGMPQGAPRDWMSYVASLALIAAAKIVNADVRRKGMSPNIENGGRTVFLRLFVDGDIGSPDSIHSWMLAARQMADAKMRAEAASLYKTGGRMDPAWFAPIQVYGYSKCWGELVALDRNGSYQWPENYTLNLSSGSFYFKDEQITNAVVNLPVSRGGFNAIDFREHIQSLKGIKPNDIVMPDEPPLPGVTEQQLRGIVAIEGIEYDYDEQGVPIPQSVTERALVVLRDYFGIDGVTGDKIKPTVTIPKSGRGKSASYQLPEKQGDRSVYLREFSKKAELEVRKKVLIIALNRMMNDPSLSALLKQEIARDNGYVSVAEFRAALNSKYQKNVAAYNNAMTRWNDAIARGESVGSKPKPPSFPKEPYAIKQKDDVYALSSRQEKKLVALLVHAIFVASRRSSSGSCPLVCGNCADITVDEADEVFGSQASFRDFQARTGAVHRCASRVPTAGYMPPPGKRLPAGVRVGPDGVTQPYYRTRDGKTRLVTGYYGAEIHIGLH